MKRLSLLLIALVVISIISVFIFSGCEAEEAKEEAVEEVEEAAEEVAEEEEKPIEAPEEEVTIEFYTSEPQEVETMEKIVSLFEEKYPNINVEITGIPFGEYYTAIKTRLLGGEVDAFVAGPGGVMTDLVEGGYCADLTGKPFLDNFYEDEMVKDAVTYDGKVRGIVLNKYVYIMVYNKDMFDEYAIDYPQDAMINYDELKNIADQFSKHDIPTLTMGLAEAWASGSLAQTITTQMSFPENIWVQIENGEEKLTGNNYRKIAEELDMWSNSGIIGKDEPGTAYDGAIALFEQARVPIISAGNWTFVSFQDLNVGSFITVTKDAKDEVYQSMPANIFCANPKSEEPKFKAAMKFLEFLSTKEAGQIFQDGTLQNSTAKGVTVEHPLLKSVDEILRSDRPTTLGLASSVNNLEIAGILDEVDTLLLRPGDKDIDEILEEKQATIDTILGQ